MQSVASDSGQVHIESWGLYPDPLHTHISHSLLQSLPSFHNLTFRRQGWALVCVGLEKNTLWYWWMFIICVPHNGVCTSGVSRSPGPVSFVFLLGGNYTGQNNFLFPPHLSVGSVSPVNSFTQIVRGKAPLHSSLLLDWLVNIVWRGFPRVQYAYSGPEKGYFKDRV